jgi:hypothetical protein
MRMFLSALIFLFAPFSAYAECQNMEGYTGPKFTDSSNKYKAAELTDTCFTKKEYKSIDREPVLNMRNKPMPTARSMQNAESQLKDYDERAAAIPEEKISESDQESIENVQVKKNGPSVIKKEQSPQGYTVETQAQATGCGQPFGTCSSK